MANKSYVSQSSPWDLDLYSELPIRNCLPDCLWAFQTRHILEWGYSPSLCLLYPTQPHLMCLLWFRSHWMEPSFSLFSKPETGSHPRLPLPLASYVQLLESSYLPANTNISHNFSSSLHPMASDLVQIITSLSEMGYFLTLAPISPLLCPQDCCQNQPRKSNCHTLTQNFPAANQ